jgi:SAM-dependent methyltransferase
MSETKFEWSPEFWQGWRESGNPYRHYKSQRDRQLVLQSLDLRKGDRVLEVGCGYGWISESLWHAADIEWTGMDRSMGMIQRLISAHPDRARRVLLSDGGELPFRDGEFDKVLCTGVLMHIADNTLAVRELIRVLRPGGWLLCSINNALSPFSLPVRLWNQRKNGFIQRFEFPSSFRRRLANGGLRLDGIMGDGIVATVPLSIGPFHFPPLSMYISICKLDEWAASRFAWLAYEVWFRGVKAVRPCAS